MLDEGARIAEAVLRYAGNCCAVFVNNSPLFAVRRSLKFNYALLAVAIVLAVASLEKVARNITMSLGHDATSMHGCPLLRAIMRHVTAMRVAEKGARNVYRIYQYYA